MSDAPPKQGPSVLILGHMRHGKDTVAEMLDTYFNYSYASSSQVAAKLFIFAKLKGKYKYSTLEDCFADRVNHRDEWYQLICEYNKDDPARLAKIIVQKYNCYVGMRDRAEFAASRDLFDLIIWVDASERVPEKEPESSFNLTAKDADITVDNNGDFHQLASKIVRIFQRMPSKQVSQLIREEGFS